MSAAQETWGHLRRESLVGDEVAVAFERGRDRARVTHRDPVRDLEASLLAYVVQVVSDLARETFELELRGELGLERDGRSGVAAHGVAGGALMRDEYLGRREREPLHRDLTVAAFVSSLGERLPDPGQI